MNLHYKIDYEMNGVCKIIYVYINKLYLYLDSYLNITSLMITLYNHVFKKKSLGLNHKTVNYDT